MPVVASAASTIAASSGLVPQGWRPISTMSLTRNENATPTSCSITARVRANSWAELVATLLPATSTRPEATAISPESAASNVDLPAPFGPIRPVTSPDRASMVTS